MKSHIRYDKRKRVEQPPIKTTKTRNQRFADLRADRDQELAVCDQISDNGHPMDAAARRELIIYDFRMKMVFLAQGFNRDGSPKSDEELMELVSLVS